MSKPIDAETIMNDGYIRLEAQSNIELDKYKDQSAKVNEKIKELITFTFEAKIPIFLVLQLVSNSINVVFLKSKDPVQTVWTPDITSLLNTNLSLEDRRYAQDTYKQNVESILTNIAGFITDGLPISIANTLLPTGTFISVLISGNLSQFEKIINHPAVDKELKYYIKNIITLRKVENEKIN